MRILSPISRLVTRRSLPRPATQLWLLPQSHSYAVRAKTLSQPRPLFDVKSVPPLSWWEARQQWLPPDLPAKNVFNAAGWYAQMARSDESTWKGKLQRDYGIDSYQLHWAACLLTFSPDGGQDTEHNLLGYHMLETGSALGYAPSIVTYLCTLANRPTQRRSGAAKSTLAKHMPKLREMAQQGNPDALFVQGRFYETDGNDDFALSCYDKAIEAGSRSGDQFAPAPMGLANYTNPSRWTFEDACYCGRGRILLRKGDTVAARDAFSFAYHELHSLDAAEELVKLVPAESTERHDLLVGLAVWGSKPDYAALVFHEWNKYLETKDDYHLQMASEWHHLGDSEGADFTALERS
ncbi:hypothetical protein QBC47DRAFT_307457 [Echria macrotheca]|uniref:Uncharacterized protein n=1 Tax=Echria macrotheca TaxID=438768 RepID=A0AAJ0B4I7_9PEZI|nr:hypothetical protein QBC47DRAFT_307457 [Echria macrotheca]